MATLLLLSVIAGLVTTIAGLGGGLLLLLGVSALHGPHFGLAATTPALLLSNVHRAYLFRSEVDRAIAKAFALGAVPAAALFGLLVIAMPAWMLSAILVIATLIAVLRYFRPSLFALGRRSLTAGGAVVGALTATSGGAGLLTSPLLMSAGLRGTAYVSTVALAAVSLHVGRLLGYGASGLLTRESLAALVALVPGLLVGNLIGKRVREHLTAKSEMVIELGALVVCTGLGVVGLVRG